MYDRNFYLRHRAKRIAQSVAYNKRNRAKVNAWHRSPERKPKRDAYNHAYYEKNKAKFAAYGKAYRERQKQKLAALPDKERRKAIERQRARQRLKMRVYTAAKKKKQQV